MSENYTFQEFEEAFRKSFLEGKVEIIGIDGNSMRSDFLREAINYGLKEELICFDGEGGDSQWTVLYYRLTDKGREKLSCKKPRLSFL